MTKHYNKNPNDGKMLVVCWCGKGTVRIDKELIGETSGPCFRKDCKEPDKAPEEVKHE